MILRNQSAARYQRNQSSSISMILTVSWGWDKIDLSLESVSRSVPQSLSLHSTDSRDLQFLPYFLCQTLSTNSEGSPVGFSVKSFHKINGFCIVQSLDVSGLLLTTPVRPLWEIFPWPNQIMLEIRARKSFKWKYLEQLRHARELVRFYIYSLKSQLRHRTDMLVALIKEIAHCMFGCCIRLDCRSLCWHVRSQNSARLSCRINAGNNVCIVWIFLLHMPKICVGSICEA